MPATVYLNLSDGEMFSPLGTLERFECRECCDRGVVVVRLIKDPLEWSLMKCPCPFSWHITARIPVWENAWRDLFYHEPCPERWFKGDQEDLDAVAANPKHIFEVERYLREYWAAQLLIAEWYWDHRRKKKETK